MSFATDKDALLAILKENSCSATKDVYNNMNSYADIPKMYNKYASQFDGDNAYPDTLYAAFDDASLVTEKIYYNKVGGTITNPKIVAKSTYNLINIDAGGDYGELEIGVGSNIIEINITNNTKISSLTIAGGSLVEKITIESGSCIDTLLIKQENGLNSAVEKIVGSCVNNLAVSPGAIFGGFECEYIPV